MSGIRGSFMTDSSGNVSNFAMALPKDMTAESKQLFNQVEDMVQQIMFSYPTEPLGVDASWCITQTISNQGMTITQETRYNIIQMDESSAILSIELEQYAEPQLLNLPDLPQGTQVALESFSGRGGGTTTISSNSLFPVSANLGTQNEMVMVIRAVEGTLTQTLDMRMNVSLNSE